MAVKINELQVHNILCDTYTVNGESGSAIFRKYGNIVVVNCNYLKKNTMDSGAWFQLPDGWKPIEYVKIFGLTVAYKYGATFGSMAEFYIDVTGNVWVTSFEPWDDEYENVMDSSNASISASFSGVYVCRI